MSEETPGDPTSSRVLTASAGLHADPAARSAAVDEAITSRRSIRAFLPEPVPRETVERILEVASRAPSGTNTQPWQVVVLTGEAKAGLTRKILAAFDDPAQAAQHTEEYQYYPTEWRSPYIDRRRKVGWDLYGLLGIGKADKAAMHAQHGRNYAFFDAPVGLIFTIDRIMQQGGWLDYGMFLQNVMVAARGRGLDTCPQQAFAPFHRIIEEHLQLPPERMVVCGMALGWADRDAVVNRLVTEREPVSAFARFVE
jgi:nitroreductase